MPMNPPCCENAMQSVTQVVAGKLLSYMATQPRTYELVELVRQLIMVHPEFAKLMDVFVVPATTNPPAQLEVLNPLILR
jgi:hypothetical protein